MEAADSKNEQGRESGFRLNRRNFIKAAVGAGSAVVLKSFIPSAQIKTAEAASSTKQETLSAQELNNRFLTVAEKFGGIDTLGARISNTYSLPDGHYMAFQSGILQLSSGIIRPWNTLDEIHKRNLDAKFLSGELGIAIPPQDEFDDQSGGDPEKAKVVRNKHYNVPSGMIGYLKELEGKGFDVGACMAPGKDFGAYAVWRFQRMAFKQWRDGRIQRELIGVAVKKLGDQSPKDAIIPEGALLPQDAIDRQFGSPNFVKQEVIPPAAREVEITNKSGLEQAAKKTIDDLRRMSQILNLSNAVEEIVIVNSDDPMLQHAIADTPFGKPYGESDVYADIYPKQNGKSTIYVADGAIGRRLGDLILHESIHAYDPIFHVVDYREDPSQLNIGNTLRKVFMNKYQEKIIGNTLNGITSVDRLILFSSSSGYGEEVWGSFVANVSNDPSAESFNLEQLQAMLENPTVHAYFKVPIREYLDFTQRTDQQEPFWQESLGKMLMLAHLRDTRFLSTVPPGMAERLKYVTDITVAKAALEALAEYGKNIVSGYAKAEDFPELAAVVDHDFQVGAGKSLARISEEYNKAFPPKETV